MTIYVLLQVLPNIKCSLNQICKFFCDIYSQIFNLSNYILFLWFLYLFYKLYVGVRDKEEDERLYSYKLKRLRKHGRIGMCACIVIGFLFLTKIMNVIIEAISGGLSAPIMGGFLNFEAVDGGRIIRIGYYDIINSSKIKMSYISGFFIYTYSIISFVCFLLFTYGIYLLIYNNKILHTKWKPSHLLIIGIAGFILFGVTLPFHIMNGMDIELYLEGCPIGSH